MGFANIIAKESKMCTNLWRFSIGDSTYEGKV